MVLQYHLHIGVGSALLVLTGRAMPEPLHVERVTDTIPRFFIYNPFLLGIGEKLKTYASIRHMVNLCL